MQMLRNLMIPSINVNEALGMVTSSGEDVQLRINGRVSSIDQVKSLLPETIKRVEWIDNPGSDIMVRLRCLTSSWQILPLEVL